MKPRIRRVLAIGLAISAMAFFGLPYLGIRPPGSATLLLWAYVMVVATLLAFQPRLR